MKRALQKIPNRCWHFLGGEKTEGCHDRVCGDTSGLRGDVSYLSGDASYLWGDASGLRGDASGLYGDMSYLSGDVSGLWGDASGLRGNIDDCNLSDDERANGVDVSDLCGKES